MLQDCPWSEFKPATITFCEHQLCAWIQTPANTWSNLAYIAVGIYVIWKAKSESLAVLSLIGWLAIMVGIGSFVFHATGTFFGELLDVGAMFLFANYVITFNLWRMFGWPVAKLVLVWASLSALSIATLVLINPIGILLFTALITIAVLTEGRLYRRYSEGVSRKSLWWLVVFFTAAFIVWVLDIREIVCDPHNHLLQGHAAWHVLNSFCFAFLYHFQRQFFRKS